MRKVATPDGGSRGGAPHLWRVRGEERDHGRLFVEVPGLAVALGHFGGCPEVQADRYGGVDREARAVRWA